jgi:microsomal dipeptidase-like Zn-dependent dipeptidase
VKWPIIDLHCDLLAYLFLQEKRTPFDPICRCAIPQLKSGNVKLQTLAIFTETGPQSVAQGLKQVEAYETLLTRHALYFEPLSSAPTESEKTQIIPAFENASSFADENEPLKESLKRLETLRTRLGRILYIGFTWNTENRFAGGVAAQQTGLKEDGKRLLEWMQGKNIACDFSHPSDRTAYEVIEYIDKHSLNIPLIASHSNFRTITPELRNLPDDLAKEIIRRDGLIGVNLFAPFIHKTNPDYLFRHIEHALHLGAENTLCFGADFFCDTDFPSIQQKYQVEHCFFPQYSNASTYPRLLQALPFPEHLLSKLAWQNAFRFLLPHQPNR